MCRKCIPVCTVCAAARTGHCPYLLGRRCYIYAPPPPLEISPLLKPRPPHRGEPSPWPRKHRKYYTPEHFYNAPKVPKVVYIVMLWYCDTLMVQICGAPPFQTGGTVTL